MRVKNGFKRLSERALKQIYLPWKGIGMKPAFRAPGIKAGSKGGDADEAHGQRKSIRVLYIVSIMPPYPGGAAVDYGVITTCMGRAFTGEVSRIRVLTERGCSRDVPEKVEIDDRLLNYDSVEGGDKKRIRQALNYLMILGNIIFSGSDVIHIHARYVYSRYMGRVVWAALLASRAKVLIDIRDRFYNNFGWGHKYLVCSEDLLGYYSWIEDLCYLPVPINPAPVKARPPEEKMAYFGSISRNKGVMELIEGYRTYHEESARKMELHFYGPNAIGREFEEAVMSAPGVRYMGVVPNDRVIEKINEYKATVLPSESEGMPRICLETIYCRRIAICHRNVHHTIPEIPEEFVLNGTGPDEFKRVFLNVERSDGEIQYGYDFAAHMPENVCRGLVSIYRECLDKKERGCYSGAGLRRPQGG